jgi:hypothetical protein
VVLDLVVKYIVTLLLALMVFACDEGGYEYEDPNLPDAPDPPVTTYPRDGQQLSYAYPDTVTLAWNEVSGANTYDVTVYSDSNLTTVYARGEDLSRATLDVVFPRWGIFYWHVRAKSTRWKGGYTGWSPTVRFIKPNPT